MKQSLSYNAIQRSFCLLMACVVFAMSLLMPIAAKAELQDDSQEQTTLADASFSKAPELSTSPESLTKLSILFSVLPKLWAWMLSVLSPEIQGYRAVFHQFFIRNVQFVFVSTLAP